MKKKFFNLLSKLVGKFMGHNSASGVVWDNDSNVCMLNGDTVSKVKIGRFPVFSIVPGLYKYKRSRMANYYLLKQLGRIQRAGAAGELNKAYAIGAVLFQRSAVYRLYFINKTIRNGYGGMPYYVVLKMSERIRRINNRLDINAIFRRVYIPKGEDGRPLGVPDKDGRVTLAMINDILMRTLAKTIEDNQHGFLPNRNVWTAGEKIIENIVDKKKVIYEFDLEACFNKISVNRCLKILKDRGIGSPMILYLRGLLTNMPIIDLKNIKPEKEVEIAKIMYIQTEEGPIVKGVRRSQDFEKISTPVITQTAILKYGLPQGWSLSPLLAILNIDQGIREVGGNVVMYADDGLIFGDSIEDISNLDGSPLNKYGMYRSKGYKKNRKDLKSGRVREVLQFAGITYNILTDCFFVNGEWMKRNDNTMKLLKKVYQGDYSRSSNDGTGDIIPDSGVYNNYKIISLLNFYNFLLGILGKGDIKRFKYRFISYAEASSLACDSLLNGTAMKIKKKHVHRRRRFADKFNIQDRMESVEYYESEFIDLIRNEFSPGGKLNIKYLDFPMNGRFQSDLDIRSEYQGNTLKDVVLYVDPD